MIVALISEFKTKSYVNVISWFFQVEDCRRIDGD